MSISPVLAPAALKQVKLGLFVHCDVCYGDEEGLLGVGKGRDVESLRQVY